jgi:hypothetical protein
MEKTMKKPIIHKINVKEESPENQGEIKGVFDRLYTNAKELKFKKEF